MIQVSMLSAVVVNTEDDEHCGHPETYTTSPPQRISHSQCSLFMVCSPTTRPRIIVAVNLNELFLLKTYEVWTLKIFADSDIPGPASQPLP